VIDAVGNRLARLDVTQWELVGTEWEGLTEHPWLREPETGDLWLWKPAEGRRLQRREDLAEAVVSRIAFDYGIPCAHVVLAAREGNQGCLSRDVKPRDTTIDSGEMLLNALDQNFSAKDHTPALHCVSVIRDVLQGKLGPSAVGVLSTLNAFDCFAGYLMLDALVLNRDRHAVNWAVLRDKRGIQADRLCPLYDNASALALSMSDQTMGRRLASRGVRSYLEREDYARRFALRDGQPDSLVALAAEALAAATPSAREHWRSVLMAITRHAINNALASVPELSAVASNFACEVVLVQRERLLNASAWVSDT
jgi:hypothetical protein